MLLYLRQELVDNNLSPFLPSLGFNIIPSRKAGLKLHFNAYRNYRYPTLNDRYWAEGGNPNLDQEKAWGVEGGINWQKDIKGWKLEADATAYRMWVDNWILWQPSAFGYWSPVNVRKVHSTGVEARLRLERRWDRWFLLFRANYQYNIPTVAASNTGSDASAGKDLIYSPRHIANATVKVSYRGIYINYTQFYTGSRYSTSDNLGKLPAYTTGDITIGKNVKKILKGLDIYLNIANLWNAEYQNFAWRPMPGRAYYAGIRFTWDKAL
jgi:iron complex outermembrane receptor protein